jgi:hypothetical protein
VFVILFCIRFKWFGLFLLFFIPGVMEEILGTGLMVGMFLFYMMNIFMIQMARIVTFGVLSTLVMYAMDRENGVDALRSEKTKEIDGYAATLKGYIPLMGIAPMAGGLQAGASVAPAPVQMVPINQQQQQQYQQQQQQPQFQQQQQQQPQYQQPAEYAPPGYAEDQEKQDQGKQEEELAPPQ